MMKQYGKRCSLVALALVALSGVTKAAPNRTDFKLDFDLIQAASQGETWKVRDALKKGANINARDGQYGWTPLMWAAREGRVGTVRLLLERGAPVNARSVSKSRAPIVLITGKARAGDIRHCIPDLTKAHEVLGYRAQEDFAEGLAELAEWVARQEAEDRVVGARKELEMRGLVA